MAAPLIAHIVFRLDYGGLENGLVNVINGLPVGKFRHAVICLTTYTDFRDRINRDDVEVFALNKKPGKDPMTYLRLWRLLRRIRPQVVHTRNTGTLDCSVVAFLAGVPVRLHGYHGWDAADLHGDSPRGTRLRRLCHPFVAGFVVVSRHISTWLAERYDVESMCIHQIYNGVNTRRFRPGPSAVAPLFVAPTGTKIFIIGTVGRLDPVKDQCSLARAFVELIRRNPRYQDYVRLVFVGDGEMRMQINDLLATAGLEDVSRILGWRDDINELLKQFDVFVLPSLNEGISNTLLEAMATAVPVIATRVGGNTELVLDNETGFLVDVGDVSQIVDALERYIGSRNLLDQHGNAGWQRVQSTFSLERMLVDYARLYSDFLPGGGQAEN